MRFNICCSRWSQPFFLLCGFAVLQAQTDSESLSALRLAGPDSAVVFVLLAIGMLIKAGAVGVHVWLPDTYAEADDDVSALLSAVISKVAIFGLLLVAYVAIRSEVSLNLAHLLGWIGMLTTLVGAMLAVSQNDMKRMLAYSSMSQLGYIVAAIALMSHLGWVTALYLVANHLMVKGILFLVVAGLIIRTGTRHFDDLGGLARVMPFTFASATIAIVAMSGLPPLAGFGGKWLLLSAMMEKGWYGPAVMTLLATFVGFLYMEHFVHAIFFGRCKAKHRNLTEAPTCLAHTAISSRRGHSGDVIFSETFDRAGFSGDRSAICVNAGVARHVVGDDLWLLESVPGHDVCGDRFRHVVWIVLVGAECRLAAAGARVLACTVSSWLFLRH